eukprot:TRINITY_DN16921_c0_g1_i1.p1 TRINITY_DN16921_c0_g1~~TRINITY_DN16921_c0_g1_i1.p1  ORF type:complete len:293 (-),score=45.77 TRINITY_DN16921_c0_g1_i1:72-950(-)
MFGSGQEHHGLALASPMVFGGREISSNLHDDACTGFWAEDFPLEKHAQTWLRSAGETESAALTSPPGDFRNFEDFGYLLKSTTAGLTLESVTLSPPTQDVGSLGGVENFRRSLKTTNPGLHFGADGFTSFDATSEQEMGAHEAALAGPTALSPPPGVWKHRSQIEMNLSAVSNTGACTAAGEANDSYKFTEPSHVVALESLANLPGPPHSAASMRSSLTILSASAPPGLDACDLPPEVASVGTVGHPLNCNAPCKFNHKTRGCLHGQRCTRCHLCHWTRKGIKSEHIAELRL